MGTVGRLEIELSADASELRAGIDEAVGDIRERLGGMQEAGSSIGDRISESFHRMGERIRAGMEQITSGVHNFGSNSERDMHRVQTASNQAGHAIDQTGGITTRAALANVSYTAATSGTVAALGRLYTAAAALAPAVSSAGSTSAAAGIIWTGLRTPLGIAAAGMLGVVASAALVRQAMGDQSQSVSQAQASIERYNQAVNQSSGTVLPGLQAKLTPIAAALVSTFTVSKALGVMSDFEQLDMQLTEVMGSAKEGKEAFAWIKDFAAKTPFDVQQAASAFVQLKNAGLDPMAGSLMSISNAASRWIQGSDGVQRAVTQLTQAYAKGKVQQEDFGVLAEAGIPVWDVLANALGRTKDEVAELANEGKLGRPEIELFIAEMGKMADGSAAGKMASLSGLMSNFGDNVTNTLDRLRTAGGLEPFKESLSAVNDKFAELADDGSLDRWAIGAGLALSQVGGLVLDIGGTFGEFGSWVAEVFSDMTGMLGDESTEQMGFLDILGAAILGLRIVWTGACNLIRDNVAELRYRVAEAVLDIIELWTKFDAGIQVVAINAGSRLANLGEGFVIFGKVAWNALQLDWAGAEAAYDNGMAEIARRVEQRTTDVIEIEEKANKKLAEVRADRANILAERNASLAKSEAAWDDVFDPKSKTKPAGKDKGKYTPSATKPVKLSGAGKKKKPTKPRKPAENARLNEWEDGLAQQKVDFERSNNEAGTSKAFDPQVEATYWQTLLQRQDLTAKERLSIERKYEAARTVLRTEATKIELEGLREGAANARASMDARLASEASLVERVKVLYGESSSEYRAALREQRRLEDDAREKRVKDQADDIQAQAAVALDQLETARAVAQAEYQMGRLTKTELLAQEQRYVDEVYRIRMESVQKLRALKAENPDVKNLPADKALDKQEGDATKDRIIGTQNVNRESSGSDFTERLGDENRQMDQRMSQALDMKGIGASFQSVEQSFSASMDAMILKGQSFKTSMAGMYRSISQTFVQEMVTKPLAALAMKYARQLAMSLATFAMEKLFGQSAAKEDVATTVGAATTKIGAHAATAAAGAAASQAPVPFVGPGLAIAAAAAMIGLVLAFRSKMKSARGGYDIPAGVDPVVQTHAEEMILPAQYANVIRNFASGPMGMPSMPSLPEMVIPGANARVIEALANGQLSSMPTAAAAPSNDGGMRAMPPPAPILNVSTIDARSFERALSDNDSSLARVLRQMYRDGFRLQNP